MSDDKPGDGLVPANDPDMAAARQLSLELGEQAEWDRVHAEAQKDGVYTGERLKQIAPVKHAMIVQLLAAGVGILKIAKLVRVSHHTVAAVRDQSQAGIAAEKGILSERMRLLVRLLLERGIDQVDEIALDKIPFFVGILTEKMQLLDGQATARIDSGPKGGMTLDSFRDYIAQLPRAEAIDVTPGEAAAEPLPPSDAKPGTGSDAHE